MPLGFLAADVVIGVGSAVVQGMQAHKANQIAESQLQMSQTIFGEQQGFEQQLEALIKDPSSVTKLPGYAFNLQQGAGTAAREMNASGFFGSGNEAAALARYGQDYATNAYMTQANLLMQLSGITAPTSPSQAGAVATGAQKSAADQWSNMFAQMGAMAGYGTGRYGSAGGMSFGGGGGGGGGGSMGLGFG